MADKPITYLIIGMVIIGLVVTLISLTMLGFKQNYTGVSFDNSSLAVMNQASSIQNLTSNMQTQIDSIKNDPNFLDQVSAFFASGFTAVKTAFKSIGISSQITMAAAQNAVPDSVNGSAGALIAGAIIAIILVIVMFVVIRSITKTDM